MIGWLIMLISVLVLIAVFYVIGEKTKDNWGRNNETIYGCIIILLFALGLIFFTMLGNPLYVKKEINEFKQYQELIDYSYSQDVDDVNFALNLQTVELNKWLASARAKEETYGIFSFYRGKIDELEYIQIKGDSE
jgi:hypothetical protein